ncbi:histidine kinase/DNA gyrase B/HSP90-like ATPase [Mucilaginibacter gracilis]|uniref:histidine kinase n=1 Tax=Mucilaginibacter gracilis TaxID=423350 RepID=A0A495J405_9SPHI|nr:histidine kinase [Mucilaginibacter gracilis]RKR83716.1 histidine kinase/DNA gyrase B/HSP90-like ATPase [Mucilaginibacter gracilis]
MNDNVAVLLTITTGGIFILVISFILLFVRNQNRLLKKQAELHETKLLHQHELLKTIIVSQEEERGRIGQDLHDDVGTALSNLRLTIEMFTQLPASGLDKFSVGCKAIIDKIITDVRHISHNLSPPGVAHYGFAGALEELCEMMSQTGAISITIDNNSAYTTDGLGTINALSLYRVMAELINNTIKHARATKIFISFTEAEDSVEVLYTDNGIGTTATINPAKGMGMQNIETRLKVIGATLLPQLPAHTGYSFRFILNK